MVFFPLRFVLKGLGFASHQSKTFCLKFSQIVIQKFSFNKITQFAFMNLEK